MGFLPDEQPCKKKLKRKQHDRGSEDKHHHDDRFGRTTPGMEDLPREIVLDILSRLPVTSLVQFQLACRSWRALARDPLLPDMQRARTAAGSPFLVFHSDYPLRNQLCFVEVSAQHPDRDKGNYNCNDKFKNPVKRFNPPFLDVMPEFDVVGSCNGLLCLVELLYKETVCIYNPFTRDYTELPRPQQYPDQAVVFGFGFHPRTKEYKVIRVVYYPNPSSKPGARRAAAVRRVPSHNMQSEVQVITLGSSPPSSTTGWRTLGRVPYQLDRKPSSEAILEGRLHWVTGPRRYRTARQLVSFDLADEQFREVPRPENGSLSRSNYQLMVLGGCLAAVVYCNYGRLEVWVMKTYNVKESWVREYTIGSYMPKGLKQGSVSSAIPFKIMKRMNSYSSSHGHNGRVARVVGDLEGSGEVLLEYKGSALVAYDPKRGKFRDIVLQGMPKWFRAFVHVGSLSWANPDSSSHSSSDL